MSQFKRWPIGLQSGPNGKPTGIGEVIRALTDARIAMFSASSDSMSILFDLQKAHRETGVPHTGNYIPTGYVEGYDLSVPEYRAEPSAAGAKRHWDHVEKRGLPPEIDWSLPCIWLSTWNEPRPYLGWSEAGSGAADEDPVPGFAGNADWMGHWAVEVGKEAVNRGYRWSAFGFAGGNPEAGFWEAPGVLEYLRLCEKHPDQLGVALHEYSHELTILNRPEKIGRFQRLHAVCDKHGIRRPVIQIKEFGWEATRVPAPDKAEAELLEVAKMYMAHPNVHGAAIWTVRKWPDGNIHEQVQSLIPRLQKLGLQHAQPIPQAGPAVNTPIVVTPAALKPAVPVGSGYVTAKFLNFRTEPSAEQGQATVISVLPGGTKVGILSRLANGWVHVSVRGQEGYVAGRYISTVPAPRVSANGRGFQGGMNVNPDAAHSNPLDGTLRGLKWVRFVFKVDDRLNSSERGDLESAFAQYDPIIRAYSEQGVNSLIILNQETRHGSPRNEGTDWQAFAQRFATTAGRIAAHYAEYGDRVAYQIWNEPDLDNSIYSIFLPPEDYAALLRPAVKAIRASAPQARIVFGGLATGPHAGASYVKQTRQALGGSLPVDAIGIHPYGRYVRQPPFPGWGFGTLQEAFDVLRAELPGWDFWITEVGIAADNPLDPAHYPAIGKYMAEVYREVSSRYADLVPVVVWFAWSDQMHNAGVVDANGQKKAPVFEAFQQVRDGTIFA